MSGRGTGDGVVGRSVSRGGCALASVVVAWVVVGSRFSREWSEKDGGKSLSDVIAARIAKRMWQIFLVCRSEDEDGRPGKSVVLSRQSARRHGAEGGKTRPGQGKAKGSSKTHTACLRRGTGGVGLGDDGEEKES